MILIILYAVAAFIILNLIEKSSLIFGVRTLEDAVKQAILAAPGHIVATALIFLAITRAYARFGQNAWYYDVIQKAISLSCMMMVTYALFHLPPKPGQIIGLCLTMLGAIIAVVWK